MFVHFKSKRIVEQLFPHWYQQAIGFVNLTSAQATEFVESRESFDGVLTTLANTLIGCTKQFYDLFREGAASVGHIADLRAELFLLTQHGSGVNEAQLPCQYQ